MIGTTVGNYRVVERLGDGGMGAVYRAVDEMLDRDVAIKVLKPELARNAALIERFRQEAIALARLNHPRIATLHGLERHGDSLLMIMEYVRGDTLEAVVQRSGRLAWQRAAELCAATLDALDHAHDKGVVHRDIKPANIMLASSGAVKVMDFGIARLIGKNRQTQVGHAVGTPMYMAPEQLRGEEVDGRTDLYATGAVLFELITGRMAFEADSDYTLMMMQLNDPPPAASKVVADVPAALDAIIGRAMAKNKEDRFPNATTFRKALEQLVRAHGPAERPVVPAETRLASPDPEPVARPVAQVASAPPATRLAPNAASSAPPTRLAADASSYESSRTTTGTTEVAGKTWTRDWRTYVAAGAVFVSAGLVVRTLRPDTTREHAEGSVVVDSTTVKSPQVAKGPTPIPTPPPQSSTSEPARETASDLVVKPSPAPPPADPAPKPPLKAIPNDRVVRQVAEKSAEKTPVVSESAAQREPTEEEAMSAIRDALRFAATSLSGRNPSAASVLGGGVQEQWTSLMKEGRVSLSVSGSPEIQRRGARASAEFDASVNVRSPFGANRRQSARFAAELEASGGGWRVVSLRPLGALELK